MAWPGLTLALAPAGCTVGASGRGRGVLALSWTPPTTKVDGSPLTDVVGYRIYFGTARGVCPSGGSFFVDAIPSAAPGTQPLRLMLKA